jgi:hypothetical protein
MTIAYFKRLRRMRRLRTAAFLAAFLLPASASPHGDDFSWPAQFKSADGTPCCTLNHVMGDCAPIPQEVALKLRVGSTIAVEFPSGRSEVTINSIYEGPQAAACRPGCAFYVPAGV